MSRNNRKFNYEFVIPQYTLVYIEVIPSTKTCQNFESLLQYRFSRYHSTPLYVAF